MNCPACGFENLSGADSCSECQSPLVLEGGAPVAKEGIQKKIMSDPIKKVGLRNPILAKRNSSVRKVIAEMKSKEVGCVLVVDKNELVGIFTERDILHKLARPNLDLDGIEIEHVMTPSPEVLDESDTIAFALNKMSMGNFRHVPIRKEDNTYTFFSVRDVLRYFF